MGWPLPRSRALRALALQPDALSSQPSLFLGVGFALGEAVGDSAGEGDAAFSAGEGDAVADSLGEGD